MAALATSTDGVEFDSNPLPLDIAPIRAETGSAGAVGSQVVVGDGSVLGDKTSLSDYTKV